jgi:hypothetical protein
VQGRFTLFEKRFQPGDPNFTYFEDAFFRSTEAPLGPPGICDCLEVPFGRQIDRRIDSGHVSGVDGGVQIMRGRHDHSCLSACHPASAMCACQTLTVLHWKRIISMVAVCFAICFSHHFFLHSRVCMLTVAHSVCVSGRWQ